MTVAQEIAALQEQCKVLEGDRDPTARAALLHKRAEIKRLQRQVGQPPLPQNAAPEVKSPEVKAAPDPEPEPEPPPAKGAAIGPRALTDEQCWAEGATMKAPDPTRRLEPRCPGDCEVAQELRSKLARTEDALAQADARTWRLSVEVDALRQQIETERTLRRGLVP